MVHTYLNVGGLVAMGFDPSGRYLLTVSHSGRGVFDTHNWQRVARDVELAYPINGLAKGIGPLTSQYIAVKELDYELGTLTVVSLDGVNHVFYEEGTITITMSRT